MKKIFLLTTILVGVGLMAVLVFAQEGEFDVLRTSQSSPYNVLEIGDGHDFDVTSEDGYFVAWGENEGHFWFTPSYSYSQAVVSFEHWDGTGPDWYLGTWLLDSCTSCGGNVYGTNSNWVPNMYTCTCPAILPDEQYTLTLFADSEEWWIRKIRIEVDTQQWYTPTPPSPTCLFSNYDFDDGNEDWGEIGSPEFVSSTVNLDETEGVSQTLSLAEPGIYYVTTYAQSGPAGNAWLLMEVGRFTTVWFNEWFSVGPTWREVAMEIEVAPGDEGSYWFRFTNDENEHPDTYLSLDWVCLETETWSILDHPLCYDDSQTIYYDFEDTGSGIVYGPPLGAGVFAVGAGQIITVAETVSNALYIEQEIVTVAGTYTVTYGNVTDIEILPGELAVNGQLLGYVGENPSGEAPYLSFKVYDVDYYGDYGAYVDPELLFSDIYPPCVSSGLVGCVLVNADFDHPVSGGWVYGGDWIYLNGATTYMEDSGNLGAFLPFATSGGIFQSVWLPEMPEPGYYNLVFDAFSQPSGGAVRVDVENESISTTVTVTLTSRVDDVFVDISDFAGSQILVEFTAVGDGDVFVDNTCIIYATEAEGNPIDFDCDFPPYPEGLDPWEWLKWLGAVIEWLWCVLRGWLIKLWLAILSLPKTLYELAVRLWTEIIKPGLRFLFEALGLGWLWDWLEFTLWPWLFDPEYGGLATWITLIIELLGQFINDPWGTIDAVLSDIINAVLALIFGLPGVQTGYDVVMAFAYLLGLLWDIISSIVIILWQAIVFVVTLAGSAISALQNPDEIEEIDISPLAVGIQLAQDAIAMTPLIYVEVLMVGLLAWAFVMWVIRQFGHQT